MLSQLVRTSLKQSLKQSLLREISVPDKRFGLLTE